MKKLKTFKIILDTLLMILGGIIAVLTITGFFSRYGWLLDLTSHFRMQYVAILIIAITILLIRKRIVAPILLIVFLIINITLIVPIYLPAPKKQAAKTTTPITVLQLNTYALNKDYNKVAQIIQESDADIITIQELNTEWLEQLEPVLKQYPYKEHAIYPFISGLEFGPGTFSKIPFETAGVDYIGFTQSPIIITDVLVGTTKVTIMNIHPMAPEKKSWWENRNQQYIEIAQKAKNIKNDLIITGDYNTTSWSHDFKLLKINANLKDTRQGIGNQATWWPSPIASIMRIPIDHVLVSKNIYTKSRSVEKRVGSDHSPILLELEVVQ